MTERTNAVLRERMDWSQEAQSTVSVFRIHPSGGLLWWTSLMARVSLERWSEPCGNPERTPSR